MYLHKSGAGLMTNATHVCSLYKFGAESPPTHTLAGSDWRRGQPRFTLETVASRHCVQPKINGPLFYVDLAKSEEGKQGWGNPGSETVLRSVLDARVLVDRELTRTYFSRTVVQTRMSGPRALTLMPYRRACRLNSYPQDIHNG